MQVLLLVAPAVALISLLLAHHLTLAFSVVEIVTMGLAALLAWGFVRDGDTRRWEGFALVAAYCGCVIAYALT
jgi:Ca2+/H+ antiporter